MEKRRTEEGRRGKEKGTKTRGFLDSLLTCCGTLSAPSAVDGPTWVVLTEGRKGGQQACGAWVGLFAPCSWWLGRWGVTPEQSQVLAQCYCTVKGENHLFWESDV